MDSEVPIQFDSPTFGTPFVPQNAMPSNGFGGVGENWGAGFGVPPPSAQQQSPFNFGVGNLNPLSIVADPTLLTNGMQNQSQKYFLSLQPYFNVKKNYVQSKLKILLFPYLHKSWHRRLTPDRTMYLPPNLDINAPDLYIPLMAFVTYVLLVGFFMGTRFKFTPDVLGTTSSTAVATIIIEVILLKLSTWLWNFPPIPILELLAYSGYKFVGITVNIISGIIFGNYGFYVSFLLTNVSTCLFLVYTFKALIPTPLGSTQSVLLRNYFFDVPCRSSSVVEFIFMLFGIQHGE